MIPFGRPYNGQVTLRLPDVTWRFLVKKIHGPFVSAKSNIAAALA